MSEPTEGTIPIYLDTTSNEPKNDQAREFRVERLRSQFERRLAESVERTWDLPAIILKDPQAEYLKLLLEARDLYVDGRFYACVAMCGIVGERLVKDLLRASVLVTTEKGPTPPSSEAFNSLERVEVSGLVSFLNKSARLGDEAAKAARGLIELRNAYAHARGKNPPADALQAIKMLHAIVEDTVSVFKHFEFREGRLAPKRQ